jgi:dihydrofolate reductase
MELIVAVYDDWGIGCCGTQPVALSADRKFFREQTRGAMVIVGRKTLADFPGGRPLPNRVNVVLTRQDIALEDVVICHSPEEAVAISKARSAQW